MNQKAKNKLKMYIAVETVCTEHQSEWNNLPAFVTFFGQFSAKVDALQHASYKQGTLTAGVAADKALILEQTIEQALIVVAALRSHATIIQSNKLRAQLDFNKWSFTYGGGQSILDRIDRIINNANVYLSSLADYGITQAHIDNLEALRIQLGDNIEAPRNAIIGRKNVTAGIDTLFKEIDILLKEHLDGLIEILRPTHPEFYGLYKGARVIIDLKGKHNQTDKDGAGEAPGDPEG